MQVDFETILKRSYDADGLYGDDRRCPIKSHCLMSLKSQFFFLVECSSLAFDCFFLVFFPKTFMPLMPVTCCMCISFYYLLSSTSRKTTSNEPCRLAHGTYVKFLPLFLPRILSNVVVSRPQTKNYMASRRRSICFSRRYDVGM